MQGKGLTEKDLKCKNHVYISGDLQAGKANNLVAYLFLLPLYLWHQVICADNEVLHEKSMELYEKNNK